ncbi:unnamed protein product, partial [Oppiella nova]
ANHVTRKEGLEFAQRKNVQFFESSAKLDINISELFSKTFDGMIKRYVLTPILKSTLKYKAVVLGDPSVGKSAIIERLCGHPFPGDISIGTQFNSVISKINHCSVIMEFWDTNGQTGDQSLAQMMPMYYRSAHTVLLVYDIHCQQSFNNLHKYL